MLSIAFGRFMHHCGSCYCSCLIFIPTQLKADILSKATADVSTTTSDVLSNDIEASFDPDHLLTVNAITNTNILDILLNSISESPINERNPDQEGATTISQCYCENEMYQLLLGTHFRMNMQDINTKHNCPLSWRNSSAH
jgi:hypothetical protein